jgi:hypothetical protein
MLPRSGGIEAWRTPCWHPSGPDQPANCVSHRLPEAGADAEFLPCGGVVEATVAAHDLDPGPVGPISPAPEVRMAREIETSFTELLTAGVVPRRAVVGAYRARFRAAVYRLPRIVGDPARVAATSRGEGRAMLATASWVDEPAQQSLWRQVLPGLTTRQ